jgi:hypothetical protein
MQWLLTEFGSSSAEQSMGGLSALSLAIRCGHHAVVRYLVVECGASMIDNNDGDIV